MTPPRDRHVDASGLLTALGLVAAWEALVRGGAVELSTVPAPSAVAVRSVDLVTSGALLADLLHTLSVTVLGWLVASGTGVVVGLVLGLWRPAWRWSMASLELLRAVPPVTLVPVAVLLFGFSMRTELTLVVYGSTWPVLVSSLEGSRRVRPELREVARTLRLSRRATLTKVVLPAAAPSIAVGLQLALSLALVLAVVSELIGNPAGLGNGLLLAQLALQPEAAFAYFFAIGLLGVTLNAGLRRLVALVPAARPHPEGAP